MNSEVSIRLVGDRIPTFIPIGAVVNYGINKIPCAHVELDPNSLGLLCDFDALRRQPVDLYIETTIGCLHFHGLIDGLSFHQSPGGLQATLVIKSPFQWLTEMYPRIIGLHPSSINVFRPQPALTWDADTAEDELMLRFTSLANVRLDTSLNLVDFIIHVMKLAITTQVLQPYTAEDGVSLGLKEMMKEMMLNRNALSPLILELLSAINTDAVSDLEVRGATKGVCGLTLQNVAMMRDNIWSNILRMLSDIGCCLVVGNSKAYVVPEAAYLTVPKIQSTHRRKRANLPNTVFPAEYDNVVFNDNGFVNVKGVYVMHDQQVKPFALGVGGALELGQYIDKKALNGNIVVTSLPAFISYGLMESAIYGSRGLHKKIRNRQRLVSRKLSMDALKHAFTNSRQMIESAHERTKKFMDQWAQIEYSRIKYDDRVGSFNTAFHNNWAPGAMGTLYTRLPGTYMDFFVTDVSHVFQLNAPNGGRANTNVMFKSGRLGAATASGLDQVDLYQYDYASAQEFSANFVKDIAT